jgi:hypothetical protein
VSAIIIVIISVMTLLLLLLLMIMMSMPDGTANGSLIHTPTTTTLSTIRALTRMSRFAKTAPGLTHVSHLAQNALDRPCVSSCTDRTEFDPRVSSCPECAGLTHVSHLAQNALDRLTCHPFSLPEIRILMIPSQGLCHPNDALIRNLILHRMRWVYLIAGLIPGILAIPPLIKDYYRSLGNNCW